MSFRSFNDTKQEIDYWFNLVRETPSDELFRAKLADAYIRHNDLELEIAGWTQLVDMNPSRWSLIHRLADAYKRNNDLDRETSAWEGLMKKSPGDLRVLSLLRDVYKRTGVDHEIASWKALIERWQNNDVTLLVDQLANAYGRKDDIDFEINEWKGLVERYPEKKDLLQELANVYKRKGDIDFEINEWKGLVEQSPNEYGLLRGLANAYKRKDGASCDFIINEWKGLVERYPDTYGLLRELEDAYKYKDDIDFEINGWKGLVEQFPNEYQLFQKLENAYKRKDDIDFEINGWKELMEQFSDEYHLFQKLASAYKCKGDINFEINGWKGLVERGINKFELFRALADAYERKGDIAFEINEWKGLTERYPNEYEMFRWLAVAYVKKGDESLAIDEWIKLARHHESRQSWNMVIREEMSWTMPVQHNPLGNSSASRMDFFSLDGRVIGTQFSPEAVREILNETTYFDRKEVQAWNKPVIVPFGTTHRDFISMCAAREGLSIKARYALGALHPANGLSIEKLKEMNFRSGLCTKRLIKITIDGFVTDDKPLINIPKEIGEMPVKHTARTYSPHGVYRVYPKMIIGWRAARPLDLNGIIDLRSPVAALAAFTGKRFLYRGHEHADFLIDWMVTGPRIVPRSRADFGHAQYYTDCFEHALLYAPQGGVITIHDWTETLDLSMRSIVFDDWERYVKFYIAKTNINLPSIPAPPIYTEDFLYGMVTENFDEVYECAVPKRTSINQVAAKTQAACEEMASRLIAIIYLT